MTDLMTIKDVAKTLKVKPRYIYRLLKERRLNFIKVGKLIRIRSIDLDAFLIEHSADRLP
jgi:excisionase family DNA binding protein